MKVLICNYKVDIVSGAEKAIVDMLLPIKNDFNFVMFVPGKGKLSSFYESKGFKVHIQNLSNKRRVLPGLHLLHSKKFSNYLKKEKYDFIMCNTFFAANKVATAARISNIPMGIFVREYFDCSNTHYKKYLSTAKVIFAVSQDVKNSLKEFHNNIVVTHDYIDVKSIKTSINSNNSLLPTNTNHEGKKIAIIGRVTPYKQQDLFVESFDFVQKQLKNVEFYIIGESSVKEKYYKDNLINISKNKNIHFLGNRNDVYDILPLFDVSCMVSNREPFPRTILESQYLKVPVVASNTGGALEMIKDFETGLFFDVKDKDPNKLAYKIIELLTNDILVNNIKDKAYNNLLDTFATYLPIQNFKDKLNESI